ncbi:Monocarboxylate 2-oxoacid-binding periplasmic protein [subsurface metagenome]
MGTMPFGMSSHEYQLWYSAGDGQKYLDILYEPFNVKCFPATKWLGELGGHSNFPITTLADMQGLIYRMGAGIEQDVLKGVGIEPWWCPGEEVYGALDRGVVDIIKWGGFRDNWAMKFHEVAAYVYVPGWQKPGMNMSMEINLDRWNALPDYQKRIIFMANRTWSWDACNVVALEAEYYEKWVDYGITITRLDDASLQIMYDAAKVAIAEKCDANPLFKEIYENQMTFIKPIREVMALKAMPVLD